MRDDGQQRPTDPRPSSLDPDLPWLHGTWQVVAIDGVDVAALPVPPWLTFDGDGVVFGDAGVNRVRGTWRLEGDALTFGPVVATLMAGTPEATAAERALLGVLTDGGTVARRAGAFTLRSTRGRVVDLVRAPAGGPA